MSGSGNLARVEGFVAAWNRRDADAVGAAFAEDAIYHNVPMEPVCGRAAIAAACAAAMEGWTEVDWVTIKIAEAADGTVLTERLDAFVTAGRRVAVPVAGIFEFRDGLITRWSDYFDLAQYRSQLAG